MTQVFSIFERLGRGGGGKINAVYKRLNFFADRAGFQPILVNMSHDLRQKEIFLELQASGRIHPDVQHRSYVELCRHGIATAPAPYFQPLPKTTRREVTDESVTYFDGDAPVYQDKVQMIGTNRVTTTRLIDKTSISRLEYAIEGLLFQVVDRRADDRAIVSNFRDGVLIARYVTENNLFKWGQNQLSGERFHSRERLLASFMPFICGPDSVTFIDGITSAYLSRAILTPKVLFLHADHRDYEGMTDNRARGLIEAFDGCVIATATAKHHDALLRDVSPPAPVHVIPHYSTAAKTNTAKQNRIVTISRLELAGKPIDQCVRAFDMIRREFPDHQYQIFGEGKGEAVLRDLIAELGCGDQVQLMGYTTQAAQEFATAKLSLYPTMAEGFGLSILESLGQGCPVISFDVDYGPREMITPGLNGELLQPGDIPALADAIRKVLLRPDHYATHCGDNLERFSKAKHDAGYLGIVQFALENTPAPVSQAAQPEAGPVPV